MFRQSKINKFALRNLEFF